MNPWLLKLKEVNSMLLLNDFELSHRQHYSCWFLSAGRNDDCFHVASTGFENLWFKFATNFSTDSQVFLWIPFAHAERSLPRQESSLRPRPLVNDDFLNCAKMQFYRPRAFRSSTVLRITGSEVKYSIAPCRCLATARDSSSISGFGSAMVALFAFGFAFACAFFVLYRLTAPRFFFSLTAALLQVA